MDVEVGDFLRTPSCPCCAWGAPQWLGRAGWLDEDGESAVDSWRCRAPWCRARFTTSLTAETAQAGATAASRPRAQP